MTHTESFPASTTVRQLRYDDETQILAITYNTGATYNYSGVPFSVYSNALKADSIGTYVAKEVKGKFEFKKA